MSEIQDAGRHQDVPSTPKEDSGESGSNRRTAILIATVAVLAAIVTALQTNASAQSARANRDAQRYAIQAMGRKTSGQAQVSYDRQGALQTWMELNDLALSADTTGDEPAAKRYRDVRDRIGQLSAMLASPYFNPDTDSWPDVSRYEADTYLVNTTELTERYTDAAARFDAWGDKANSYVVHLTLLAVSLSLFGLSTTLSSRARKMFVVVGSGIVVVTLAWAVLVYFSPVSGLPEDAMKAYARGAGLSYQDQMKDAIAELDKAINLAPTYATALYERANAYYNLDKFDEAVADYEKARASGRDDTNVGWNLGWTYYLMGRFEDAKRVDQHVLDLDPTLIGVRLNLGVARLVAGENAAAKSDYADAMQMAAKIVTDAKAAGHQPPASLGFYLDAGSVDLQNLLDRLNGEEHQWTQAPPLDKIEDPDSVRRIAEEMIQELKSLTAALEYTGRPAEGSTKAKIGEFTFGQAIYDANGDFVRYDRAKAYAYRTKEVLVLFDYEGMRVDQQVIFKVLIDGQEYEPLRQVVKWPEKLGEKGSAQYPISYAYSQIFIMPVGEYVVEMYVDSQLVQKAHFSVKHSDDLLAGESGTMLFRDDFSDTASGWSRTHDSDFSTDYVDGHYEINVIKDTLVVHATPDLKFADVSIDVDATKTAGPDDGNFGVICRYQDSENYYLMQISGDGYYGIYKQKAGKWNLLNSDKLKFSDAILQGDKTNHIHAECAGDKLALHVNDQQLAEVQDADFASGDVGLLAGTFDKGGAVIAFDNLVVRQPGEAPAAPAAKSGDVLFRDDFSDPSSGWPSEQDLDRITDYAGGQYRIEVDRTNYSVWATPGMKGASDASIEADVTKSGGPDNNNFGLVCRYQDADNFYAGQVTSDGFYAMIKRKGGEWVQIGAGEWQASDVIRKGAATNHVRLDCVGDRLTLYVNDDLLAEAQDADFATGDVGMLAGTYDTSGVDILFDNFVVTQP